MDCTCFDKGGRWWRPFSCPVHDPLTRYQVEKGIVEAEPDEPVGWWGPWVLLVVLLAGSILLWHLLGAPVWEGGF